MNAFISCDGSIRPPKSFIGSHGNVFTSNKDERVFFTTSKQMSADLGELLLKIGKRPSYHVEKVKGKVNKFKNGSYVINEDSIKISECSSLTATVFEKDYIDYDGVVYDLTLSKNSTMYIRRNGKCFWGSNCRCHTEDILATEDEFINHQKKLIDGKESELKSVNEVSEVPNNYTKWVADNTDRMMNAKNLPYFIADNSNVTPQIFINYSKAFSEQFANKVSIISRNTGSVAVDTNIKKDERILKKAKDDYNGQVSMVKDIVRTTIIADEGSIQSVISEVGKQFDIYRIKNQLASIDPLGYSGTIINVRTSSTTFAEVQVNSALMIYGKEKNALRYLGENLYNRIKSTTKMQGGLGRGYYDEWRKLDRKIPVDLKRMKELEKISSDYYNKLRKFKI